MYPMGYISKLSEKQSIIKFPITKNDKTALPNTTTQLKKKKILVSEALLKCYLQI